MSPTSFGTYDNHSIAALDDSQVAQVMRRALGHYASGLTVITGRDESGPVGFTCQSFHSVSLDPPLVSFSVMKASTSFPRLRLTGRFCVNVLSASQIHLSNRFASKSTDKWEGVSWHPTDRGNPSFAESLAWVDCDLRDVHDAGDHHIVTGEVRALGIAGHDDKEPLLYFQGSYRYLRDA